MLYFHLKNSLIFTLLALFLSLAIAVRAQSMQSQQYQLQSEEVTTESSDQNVPTSQTNSLDAVDLKKFNQNGYVVSADNSSFSISVDNASLNLGSISQNKVEKATEGVHLSSATGSQLRLSEENSLTSLTGSTIQPTRCDTSCTVNHAEIWQNNQIAGLGYSLKGAGIPEDFINTTYYRQLADLTKNQSPVFIFRNEDSSTLQNLQLLFKLASSSDSTENYSTVIHLEALPGY